jgi:aminoglycoside phosphotransferase family enzyme/predicted kinase
LSQANNLPELIDDLLDPSAYPHPVEAVRLIQTHISYLLLTGGYVYKVKKPVDFGFLDYTTLEKRRHFCHEEVRLNRRLSPDVYLGVVEVRRDASGRHRVDQSAEGHVVEYAVKMRELPQEAALSHLLAAGKADAAVIERLAQLVAGFHQKAETNDEIASYGSLEKVKFSIDENFSQTAGYIGRTISADDYDRLKGYSEEFMRERAALFEERVSRGKIRDCHGDLHTQNVYLTEGHVYVLDGIEFNRRFRYLDTTADLAFLLMDLDYRGFPRYTNRLLNTYLQFTNDYHLLGLLDFYRVYRAYVRGKISSFELDMAELEPSRREEVARRAESYFKLARRYADRPSRPLLIATSGLIGSGKSYLARLVAGRIGAAVVRSDAVRKVLVGAAPTESMAAPYGAGIYSAEMTERVYEDMLTQARFGLEAGWPVVMDATYAKASQRAGVVRLAAEGGWPLVFVHCGCHDEVIMQRLIERAVRRGVSDAGPDLLERVRADFESPRENEGGRLICVNSAEPEEERVRAILQVAKSMGVSF